MGRVTGWMQKTMEEKNTTKVAIENPVIMVFRPNLRTASGLEAGLNAIQLCTASPSSYLLQVVKLLYNDHLSTPEHTPIIRGCVEVDIEDSLRP